MRTLIASLIAFLTAMFNNIEYVPPDDKPFSEDSYYSVQTAGYPDDQALYNSTLARITDSGQSCDLTPIEFDGESTNTKLVELNNSGVFPFAVDSSKDISTIVSEAQTVEVKGAKYYLFTVAKGTPIVAPFNCTLDRSSIAIGDMYPKVEPCRGISLTVETDALSDGSRYKITYASLERLWDSMRKTEPDDKMDNQDSKPIYYSDAIVDDIKFNQKNVLGVAGKTGLPDGKYTGEAYILIKIEKYELGAYRNCTLKDFCGLD